MTGAFGREVTTQYLTGLYSNLATLGEALQSAADGAAQVSTGVTGVATGLDSLAAGTEAAATGAASAATGATAFSSGVNAYTGGVDSLSSGLGALSSGAAGLSQISGGWSSYTGGVAQTASGFESLKAAILANPSNDVYAGALTQFQAGLDTLSTQGAALSGQTTSALSGVQSGIGQSATGAATLSGGSAELRSGAAGIATGISGLSTGVAELATGSSAAATGARALETGASDLASGLADGATGAATFINLDATATAAVVSEPVAVTTDRDNPVAGVGSVIGTLFVPVSLWIGALAAFAALAWWRPTDPALHDKALTEALSGFARIGTWAVAVLVLTGLINSLYLVGWNGLPLLPATLWGQLLIAKLGLFMAMLALAALNRFQLTSRLKTADPGTTVAIAHLRASLLGEFGLAIAVLALVAIIGTLAPPASLG